MLEEPSDEPDERRALIRQVRQRLESLRRAGVDHISAVPLAKSELSRARVRVPAAGTVSDRAVDSEVGAPSRVEHRPAAVAREEAAGSVETSKPVSLEMTVMRKEKAGASSKPAVSPAKSEPAAATVASAGPTAANPAPVSASLFAEPRFESAPVPADDRPAVLAALAAEVAVCARCPQLAATRTQTVFGCGTPTARLMFIGEAPGADEDRVGQPFVGRAGQLLTDMITKGMGLAREEVYIANVLKCRPPENRTPTLEEAANCSSYLAHQIAVVRPEFLCLLGKTAASAILEIAPTTTLGQLRKRWHHYRGTKVLVTYHPSYLLRTPSAKKDAWEDLQLLMKEMGLPIPGKKGRE